MTKEPRTKEFKSGLKVAYFENLTDILDWCESEVGNTQWSGDSERTDNAYVNWSGTSSLKDAIKIGREGWSEGAKKIKKNIDGFHVVGLKTTPAPHYEVSGDSVDVGRFLSGEPENMLNWEEVEEDGHKVVDIYYNCAVSGRYDADCITRYGSAVVSVIDYLESTGRRCNLYAYWSMIEMSRKATKRAYVIQIKRSEEALNIASCAFCLGHPSFVRRILFKTMQSMPEFRLLGYGMPQEFKELTEEAKESVVFQTINNAGYSFKKDSHISEYVKNKLPEVLNSLEVSEKTKFDF